MTEWLMAALMGLVEGLTEFLPVSSTGHLILLGDLLGFKGPDGKVFEITIQLGAILAIVVLYAQKLFGVLFAAPRDAAARRFIAVILIAFLPAAVIGAAANSFIKAVLFNPTVVALSLVLGGVLILLIERMSHRPRFHAVEELPPLTALKIGFIQCIAMIPGVSRSGATIMGAVLMGVERKTAAEFSFFLAVPTMLGAAAYSLYKSRNDLSADGMTLVAIGFAVAFVSALAVVKAAVGFISRHGFAPFGWYRIGLGLIILALLHFR